MTALLVAIGAALGGAVRYVAAVALDGRRPAGTLLVNLAGSALLGLSSRLAVDEHLVALVGTGFCGALTTFSAFALQTVERPPREGAAYAVATVVGSLGLCAAGWWLAARLA